MMFLKISKYLLPYDIYERHKKIASFIEKGETVLDIGGQLGSLSQFCHDIPITVANLKESQEKSDVTIHKGNFPFKNDSFSTVCAIDVLEHVSKQDRLKFTNDLLKIAKNKVLLSFPIGTKAHIEYEKRLQKLLKIKNKNVPYLAEHIKFGLPTPQEVNNLKSFKKVRIYYSGNLTVNNFLFKIFLFDPKIKFLRKIIYFFKKIFNLITNPIIYFFLSTRNFSDQVIRAYVIIKK